MVVTIGSTVLYRLTEDDVLNNSSTNYAQAGDSLPLIVVKVWENEFGPGKPGVNGQLILDGNPGTMWVTSKAEGTKKGTWYWPARV